MAIRHPRRDGLARLAGNDTIDRHGAALDRVTGARAAGEQAARDEQFVEPLACAGWRRGVHRPSWRKPAVMARILGAGTAKAGRRIRRSAYIEHRARSGKMLRRDAILPVETRRRSNADGSCHCGAAHWTLEGDPGSITACNCTLCSRYGALWAYDYVDERIRLDGPRKRLYARWRERPCARDPLLSNVRLRPGLARLAPQRRRSLPDRRQRQACAARRPSPTSRSIISMASTHSRTCRAMAAACAICGCRRWCAKPAVRRPAPDRHCCRRKPACAEPRQAPRCRLGVRHDDELRNLFVGKAAADVADLAGDDVHHRFFEITVVARFGHGRRGDDGRKGHAAQKRSHCF